MLRLMGNPGRRYATGTRPFSLVDPVMDRRALERIASVNFICAGREGRNQNASLERTIWLKKKKIFSIRSLVSARSRSKTPATLCVC